MVRQILSFLAFCALLGCNSGLDASIPATSVGIQFPDVGQGHAAAVWKDGQCILVDAGPDSNWIGSLSCTRISGILITHWDLDHRGGLASVLARFPVEHIYYGHLPQEDSVKSQLDKFCRIASSGCQKVVAGDELNVLGGVNWKILSTGPDSIPDGNETSVVSRISNASGSLLVAGDLDSAGEQLLALQDPAALQSDVLELSHHGSGGSNSLQWLGAVRPRRAVIQCGKNNRYGHPSEVTMERLRALAISTWVTSDLGSVRMTLHGDMLQ